MSDLHDLLDRKANRVIPSPDAWDRLQDALVRRRRGRRVGTVALSFVVLAVALAGLWVAFRPRPADRPAGTSPRAQPRVTATIPVEGGVTDVAIGFGSVWAPGPGKLTRIDPSSGRVLATIPVPGDSDYRYVTTGFGAVWVAEGQAVCRIDPGTNRIVATIEVPGVTSIAAGEGAVWAAGLGFQQGDALYRIDPSSNRVIGEPIDAHGSLAIGGGSVWVNPVNDEMLQRVDPVTLRVEEVGTFPISGMAFGDGSLWVTRNPFVARLAADTGEVIAVTNVQAPSLVAASDSSVWVVSAPTGDVPGRLVRIDPRSNAVSGDPVEVGMTVVGVAAQGDTAWVANFADGTLMRVELTSN